MKNISKILTFTVNSPHSGEFFSKSLNVTTGQNLIDQTILNGLFRTQEVIPIGILLDLFQWLASMMRQNLIQFIPNRQNFLCVDSDIGRSANLFWLRSHRSRECFYKRYSHSPSCQSRNRDTDFRFAGINLLFTERKTFHFETGQI